MSTGTMRPMIVGEVRDGRVVLKVYSGRPCPACRDACHCRCDACGRSGREMETVEIGEHALQAMATHTDAGPLARALLRATSQAAAMAPGVRR